MQLLLRALRRGPGAPAAATAAGLIALLGACRAGSPLEGPIGSPEVRPSREEIFLEPSPRGNPPAIESLSADGRWLLLRWSARRDEERRRPELRLLNIEDPAASGHRGTPLTELLPQPTGNDEEPSTAWSERGSRLAVAWGDRIWILDPATLRLDPLLAPPPVDPLPVDPNPVDFGPGRDPEEDPDEGRGELRGSIRGVSFAAEDTELRFEDRQESYSLPVPPLGERIPAATLAQARWWTEGIDAPARQLRWSDDRSVVAGTDPVPRKPAPEGDAAQVLHRDEDREVTLEGLAEIASLESFSLSPDGRFACALDVDREGEPESTIVPDYLTERVTTSRSRRTLADGRPSPRTMWMWDTNSGERMVVAPFLAPPPKEEDPAEKDPAEKGLVEEDLDEGSTAEDPPDDVEAAETPRYWVSTIGWAPRPEADSPPRFAFTLVSEDYRDREIWCWSEGESRNVWRERDERWIGGPTYGARWSRDGSQLLVGSEMHERSTTKGRNQLFAIDVATGDVRQLTEVEGELRRFRVLPDDAVLVQAAREDPGRSEVGVLAAPTARGETEGEVTWFPVPAGWNTRPAASRDGTRVVFAHETLAGPAELYCAERDRAARLTRTVPRGFDEIDWILPRLVEVDAEDGTRVRAHVWLPPGVELDADVPRAAVMFVHGAGYLQNVTDSMGSYPLNTMFHSRLAHLGYPVIDVDYRGSAGYGRDFRTDVQYHLGGKDLDDLHLVVDHLAERGLVDRDRVGLYGGSYGGFLTLMALFTAPERWACGAALRSVTDWRSYHPTYTQPRLGRPSTHAEAYARSCPIDHVDGLEDPLYILHGLVDRNVFAQDSIRLVEALIDRGKEFDAMFYPSQGHAFEDENHWLDEYRRIEDHLRRHLGPPLRDPHQP